jgi:peroxiredoxin family protein
MAEVMGLKKEHLDEIVDDIVGAAFFMKESENMKVIFI